MKQPYVSTLIEQDFTSAEKALGRHNIDAISSADLEGYATQEWVQDQNYITSADLPDVSDMATRTWTSENFYPDTNPSGFITSSDVPRYREGDYISIDPISLAISVTGINPDDYATHEEVESATSGKMDASEASAFYPRYDNPESYITSADLPDLSDYVTSADVSGFVDMNYVDNNFYSASNPSGFITSADIPPVQQVQSDWTEYDNTEPSYIQNKPVPAALEAISPLYIIDESSASRIGIESSALPSMTGIGLKAGYGIQFVDETSAVKINSNVPYPSVECHPISVEYSGVVLVIYPQSSACCEMHVTTPKNYNGAESYSARINDDYTYVIPSGCWYDFVKQDGGNGMEWWMKDSGTLY